MKKIYKILNTLNNARLLNAATFKVAYSRPWIIFLELLYKEGLIQNYLIKEKKIIIFLRYLNGKSSMNYIKVFISPTKFRYIRAKNLWLFQRFNGILFISTTQGILTHANCLRQNLGGQLLFFIS